MPDFIRVTTNELISHVWVKVDEQIDRLERIIEQIPPATTDWKPPLPSVSFSEREILNEMLGHVLGCLAGFLAALYAARPDELSAFLEMKQRRASHAGGTDETLQRIEEYRRHIRIGFAALTDADLSRTVPTVFVPLGESVLTLLLGNFEHLVNHKHELFYYVKLLGVPLTSRDLYRFRGEVGAP